MSTQKLTDARIDHGAVHTYGTPRRLVVAVEAVAERQKPRPKQVLGPPERVALDAQGRHDLAARKFAEKVGLPADRLSIVDTEKGRYLCAVISDKGTSTEELAAANATRSHSGHCLFPKPCAGRIMNISFARPIHSILALLGKSVISFTLGGRIKSGRQAWGHMFMNHKRIKIESADDYLESLRKAQVIVDIPDPQEDGALSRSNRPPSSWAVRSYPMKPFWISSPIWWKYPLPPAVVSTKLFWNCRGKF